MLSLSPLGPGADAMPVMAGLLAKELSQPDPAIGSVTKDPPKTKQAAGLAPRFRLGVGQDCVVSMLVHGVLQGSIQLELTDKNRTPVVNMVHDPDPGCVVSVSYTHLRAHETPEHLVCRLLLEKKKRNNTRMY
eukprot:TRINITY_DN45673_c0_g1_i1.p2 TRINITY_DN45673_c0_g1~~TRINITY_DN45673_c0_g1_i1.p2  ORF type:complete len:133 (-),score=26.15 TRINITY_DN45673_c0_g1_i1:18-416(-)